MGGLTLATVSGGGSTFLFGNLPTSMKQLNVGNYTNNAATGPFATAPYNTTGWHAFKYLQDTVAVSCSWFTTSAASNKWLITPAIANITSNTVLTWEALAGDTQAPDGYEVWATTTNNANPQASDFTSNPNNRLLVVTEENTDGFTLRGVSLAQFAGQTVRLAFRNTSTEKYILMIDDIQVKTGVPSLDGGVQKVHFANYISVGQKQVKATLQNWGLTAATSMEVKYQIDNGSIITELASFPQALGYAATYDYTFTNLGNFSAAGTRILKVWVTKVNTQSDTNLGNNEQTLTLNVLSAIPPKKTLVRQFTGTWGGYCPDGDYKAAQLKAQNPNKVVVMAVHDNDGMTNADGEEMVFTYMDGASFPSATIDDKYFTGETAVPVSREKWASRVSEQLATVSPVKISIVNKVYNPATRKLDVDVKVEFYVAATGSYRVNMYLVEDSVSGTGTNFNQANLFNAQQGSPFYNKGNPIVNYQHNNVFLGALGGALGNSGVIPTNVLANAVYTKHYSVTLPAQSSSPKMWKPANIRLIAVVNEHNASDVKKRTVLNVEETKLLQTTTDISEQMENLEEVVVYPNPTENEANLRLAFATPTQIQVSLYNLNGQLIKQITNNQAIESNYDLPISTEDLASGLYLVKIQSESQSFYQKLWVRK
ncbi:MAG: Omp28-related outer membrane protein [Ferruginibacter sp.]